MDIFREYTDYSNFTRLTIDPNSVATDELCVDGGEWTKGEVLTDLVDSDIINCYPGKLGWADYIVTHVLAEVDYDYELVEAFFKSDTATKLTLDLGGGGEVTIIKSVD